jgi:hypothetical protein
MSIKPVALMQGLKSDKILYVTCTQFIQCIHAKVSSVFTLQYVAKSFVRPTREQTTFRWGAVGHVYRYVKGQTGG